MNLVQVVRGSDRRLGVVEDTRLRLLASYATAYSLALTAIEQTVPLSSLAGRALSSETLDYDAIYEGRSEWHLLPSFDHPDDPAHCLVSGTGLTHKVSAENRSAMHKHAPEEITDSIRMYRLGLDAGGRRARSQGPRRSGRSCFVLPLPLPFLFLPRPVCNASALDRPRPRSPAPGPTPRCWLPPATWTSGRRT